MKKFTNNEKTRNKFNVSKFIKEFIVEISVKNGSSHKCLMFIITLPNFT